MPMAGEVARQPGCGWYRPSAQPLSERDQVIARVHWRPCSGSVDCCSSAWTSIGDYLTEVNVTEPNLLPGNHSADAASMWPECSSMHWSAPRARAAGLARKPA
ncbi:hypothetical protein ACU4GD_27250 [Cupriavidus basilensis]